MENNKEQELFARQLEREQLMVNKGIERYHERLNKMIDKGDYARAKGGQLVEFTFLESIAKTLQEVLEDAAAGKAGTNYAIIGPMWQRMQSLRLLDLKTGESTDKCFNPLSVEEVSLIVIRRILNECKQPIVVKESEAGRTRRKAGARRIYSEIVNDIARSVDVQVKSNFIRKHLPDKQSGQSHFQRVQEWSYKQAASIRHKDKALKRGMRKAASHFEERGIQAMAALYGDPMLIGDEASILVEKVIKILEDVCMSYYGPIFEMRWERNQLKFLQLTEAGLKFTADLDYAEEVEKDKPILLPMLVPPKAHTADGQGGYLSLQYGKVKKQKGDIQLSAKHREFMNDQQEVGFHINQCVLEVMKLVKETLEGPDQIIGDFKPKPVEEQWAPPIDPEIIHAAEVWGRAAGKPPSAYSEMQKARRLRATQQRDYRDKVLKESEQSMTELTLEVAEMVKDDPAFYLPVKSEFRGRINPAATGLTYQGSDMQKGLIEFAEPVEVDDRTEYWFCMGLTANAGEDKLTITERLQWVEDHREQIAETAHNPLKSLWWRGKKQDDGTEIDCPWAFLALAIEYTRLFIDKVGPRLTRARIPYDAVCSGQQIISGITGCGRTARAVCLAPAGPEDPRKDVYSDVLKVARKMARKLRWNIPIYVNEKLEDGTTRLKVKGRVSPAKLKKMGRSVPKQPIVSGQYGSCDKTRWEGIAKKGTLDDKGTTFTMEESEAVYKQLIKPAMNEVMPSLDIFLEWMKSVCKHIASRSKGGVVKFKTPDGTVVTQVYRKMDFRKVATEHVGQTSLKNNRSRRRDYFETPEADWGRMERGIAPNFIHALDSNILSLGLAGCGAQFATVHDSIYVRPSREADMVHKRLQKAYHTVFTAKPLEVFLKVNGVDPEEFPIPYVTDDVYDPNDIFEALYFMS